MQSFDMPLSHLCSVHDSRNGDLDWVFINANCLNGASRGLSFDCVNCSPSLLFSEPESENIVNNCRKLKIAPAPHRLSLRNTAQ